MAGRFACLGLAAAAVLLFVSGHSAGQAPRSAALTVKVAGDESFGKELRELVETTEEQQPSQGDAIAVLQGVEAHRQRLARALRSRGYYGGDVIATVAGRPLDDPDLVQAIEARPQDEKVSVVLAVTTGPLYRIANLDVTAAAPDTVPPVDRTKLALTPGKPADSKSILEVEDQLLVQTRGHGYALAEVVERSVTVDHATQRVHVTFLLRTGPAARMGEVRFTGTEKIDTTFLQRRVPFTPGEPYDPEKVRKLTDRLTSLGVFNAVRVKPDTKLDDKGQLPFEVELKDRPPRSIGFGAAYETTLGASINAYWMHRNLFGQAESLRIGAEINRLFERPWADMGFMFRTAFRKPDWWEPYQDFTIDADVAREIFDAYRRRGARLVVGLDRLVDDDLRIKAGIAGEYSVIERSGITRTYQLLGLPLAALLDKSNNELDPTDGWRLAAHVSPYVDTLGVSQPFAILRLTGTAYFDIFGMQGWQEVGRSVLAVRGSVGTIPGGRVESVPPDKLFYAGGGGSVRGFAYQSAGPRDAFNVPTGGTSVVEASVEFRQRIGQQFGVVLFVDAGNAYASTLPNFNEAARVGAGAGLRYYTDFGPLRLDVGFPVNRRDTDALFGVYVSLGQAF